MGMKDLNSVCPPMSHNSTNDTVYLHRHRHRVSMEPTIHTLLLVVLWLIVQTPLPTKVTSKTTDVFEDLTTDSAFRSSATTGAFETSSWLKSLAIAKSKSKLALTHFHLEVRTTKGFLVKFWNRVNIVA